MIYHSRKAVVLSVAITALLSTSGCFGGGGGGDGFFGWFSGSSFGDSLASFGEGSGDGSDGLSSLFDGSGGGDEGGILNLVTNDLGDNTGDFPQPPPIATVHNPEPMSLGLFGVGLAALGASRRRKTSRRTRT